MPISRGLREIMGVFGPMLDVALEFGRGTQQMWQALNTAYANAGIKRPRAATLQDMNTFRAGLGGFVRSVNAFATASDEAVLNSAHWTYPIGYEPTAADFAAPSLTATFEAMIQTPEGPVTRWSSVRYTTFLPATVGQLRTEAMAAVQEQLDVAATEEGELSPTAGGTVGDIGRMYAVVRGL